MIELPVEQFGLFAVRESTVISEESGLGQQAWPKPPSFRAIRVFSDGLVAAFVLAEFVLDDLDRDRQRYIDDDTGIVLVGISENTATVRTAGFLDPDSPVRVRKGSCRSFVTWFTSGRSIVVSVGIVVGRLLAGGFGISIGRRRGSTAPAGWSVRVVVASEASFEFSDLLFEFQNVAISVGELLSEGVDFGFEVGDALFPARRPTSLVFRPPAPFSRTDTVATGRRFRNPLTICLTAKQIPKT